jgi:hypothetical protein
MVRKESAPTNLSIANQFMGGSLMGLELEKGGLDDLKFSFETGDGAYTLGSPRHTLTSPLALSLEMPELEDEEGMFGKRLHLHLLNFGLRVLTILKRCSRCYHRRPQTPF